MKLVLINKLLQLLVTVGVLAIIIGFIPFGHATTNVQGQVTITPIVPGTCGLEATAGAPIQYGSLTTGDTSQEQTLRLNNTGDSPTSIFVSGSSWIKFGPTEFIMPPTNTHYSGQLGIPYTAKSALTNDATDTGVVVQPGLSKNIIWQLAVFSLADPTFTGPLVQSVTASGNC